MSYPNNRGQVENTIVRPIRNDEFPLCGDGPDMDEFKDPGDPIIYPYEPTLFARELAGRLIETMNQWAALAKVLDRWPLLEEFTEHLQKTIDGYNEE